MMTIPGSYLDQSLMGKVALVTGGGTGIGRGVADAFVAAGADVVVAGRRSDPLTDFCTQHPEKSDKVQMKVGKEDDRRRAVDAVLQLFGRLDILINNALAVYDTPFPQMTLKQIEITYLVLLNAPTRLTQLASPISFKPAAASSTFRQLELDTLPTRSKV